jgi:hypothetical protein
LLLKSKNTKIIIQTMGIRPIKFKKIMTYTKIKRKKIKNISNLMFASEKFILQVIKR